MNAEQEIMGMSDSSDENLVEEDQVMYDDDKKDELDDLFGSTSSSEDDVQNRQLSESVVQDEEKISNNEESRSEAESENEDEQPPSTSFSIPEIVKPFELGYECMLVKVPAFLRTQMQEPFDPVTTVDQEIEGFGADPDDIDAYIATRVLTTIRFRSNLTLDNRLTLESNTRLVEWEDGTMSLAVGDELFEVVAQNISGEHNYIFQKHTGVGCMEVLRGLDRKLLIRPYITDTGDHRRFLAINPAKIDTTTGEKLASGREPARVRMAQISTDPEAEKTQQARLHQEKIRARRQQENRRRNLKTQHRTRPLSTEFLEADSDNADMDEYEEDFIDDTGLFEDEVSSEPVGSESGELEDSEDEVYGKSRKKKHTGKKIQNASDQINTFLWVRFIQDPMSTFLKRIILCRTNFQST